MHGNMNEKCGVIPIRPVQRIKLRWFFNIPVHGDLSSLNNLRTFFTPTRLWIWNRQSVPKRWHIKFRLQGITQKKAYNNSKDLVQWWVTSIAEPVVMLAVSIRLSNTLTACYRHSQPCRWGHLDSGMWHGFIRWLVSDVLRRRRGIIFTGRNVRELKPIAQWRDVTWRQNGDVRQTVTSNRCILTPFTRSYTSFTCHEGIQSEHRQSSTHS